MSRATHEATNRDELRTFAVVITAGSVLFIFNLFTHGGAVTPASASPVAQVMDVVPTVMPVGSIEKPSRIKIQSIAVNAVVEHVALTKDGSMDVPKRPWDAAWYELGPRPGEAGSAVLAGHIDWYNGAKGVFKNLYKLRPGNTIQIQDKNGVTTTFVVKKIRTLDASADATELFHSEDGKSHLNIVTCDGVWDRRAKQYTKRLVVFADKKE
jgi:LPXTG-site transpeptidase (sortase) family protein